MFRFVLTMMMLVGFSFGCGGEDEQPPAPIRINPDYAGTWSGSATSPDSLDNPISRTVVLHIETNGGSMRLDIKGLCADTLRLNAVGNDKALTWHGDAYCPNISGSGGVMYKFATIVLSESNTIEMKLDGFSPVPGVGEKPVRTTLNATKTGL